MSDWSTCVGHVRGCAVDTQSTHEAHALRTRRASPLYLPYISPRREAHAPRTRRARGLPEPVSMQPHVLGIPLGHPLCAQGHVTRALKRHRQQAWAQAASLGAGGKPGHRLRATAVCTCARTVHSALPSAATLLIASEAALPTGVANSIPSISMPPGARGTSGFV